MASRGDGRVPNADYVRTVHTVDDPIPALKQQLRDELIAVIGKYEQYSAADAIGTDQPRMSDLQYNRLKRFSLETLIRFLTRVECRVELRVVRLSASDPRIFRFPPVRRDLER